MVEVVAESMVGGAMLHRSVIRVRFPEPWSSTSLANQAVASRACRIGHAYSRLGKRLGVISKPQEQNSSMALTPKVTVSIDSIPVGFFHNLSQVAAAEKLLRMNEGHPLSTHEILDAFRKSGMEITSKHATTVLYTALKRSPKFERVAGKAWGLAEWYPEKKKRGKDEEAFPAKENKNELKVSSSSSLGHP